MTTVKSFDSWLASNGPVALVIREYLMSVEGSDGVVFPATFAAGDNFPGGYNIDGQADGDNICLIDTVGSQANRIEPIFTEDPYKALVPQIVITAGDSRINLLTAGHRAGDAIVRCSSLHKDLHDAFTAVLKGNAEPLAKIAPTSLVFGVWDSRDTQAKLPRLIASTIRAYNVRKLTRSAQYVPAAEYVALGLLDEPADKKAKDAYAVRGFIHVPASGAHGGVVAHGGIRRDATLSLAALRPMSATGGDDRVLKLKRYILGLALAALTQPAAGYLRQGCNLVLDPEKPREFAEVHFDGRRILTSLTSADALEYARQTAKDFGVGPDREVPFDKKLAMQDVGADGGEDKGRKAGRKK